MTINELILQLNMVKDYINGDAEIEVRYGGDRLIIAKKLPDPDLPFNGMGYTISLKGDNK